MTASKTFEIDDNHLLLTVLGAENRHIAVLEEELGLNIQTRGNLITLEGTNRAIRLRISRLWPGSISTLMSQQ